MAKARIGMVGLGVMGRNLSLNIAENGFVGRCTTGPPPGLMNSWPVPGN